MALPEVASSEAWLRPGSRYWPWLSDRDAWVTDAVATALTELGAPRRAETTHSGDIPEHWPSPASPRLSEWQH
jgi:hypothetical protein